MTILTESPTTVFTPPAGGFAPAPAEARGTPRDAVRLLVAEPGGISHAAFRDLPQHLRAGDVVVVNNSATVAGEIDAVGPRGPVVLHLATPLDDTASGRRECLRHLDPGGAHRTRCLPVGAGRRGG